MPLESPERVAETSTLDAPLERRRMLIVVNPYATTVSDRLRNLVVSGLRARYDVDAVDTQRRDHATGICRQAAHDGYDVVVSFGGDGTVNEVANGLAGSDTPLTCLPGGATNVLCKMLGIPGEIVDATEHLLHMADDWRPRRIDLGTVNGRCFTYTSGMGLDATVIKRVEERLRLRSSLRRYYYAYATVATVLRRYSVRPQRIEAVVGDRTIRGVTVVVQNGDPMTYFDRRPLHVAEGAQLDSGTLAGVVLRRSSPVDIPGIAWRIFSRRARVSGHRQVSPFADVTELRCVSVDGAAIPLQVDGDHIGDVREAVYGLRPRALAVVS